MTRSSAVVIFMFRALPSTSRTAVARPLGQRRLVGRLDAASAQRHRLPQHLAPERLRRLRQEDRLARQRPLDQPRRRRAARGRRRPLDRVARRHRHDRRARLGRRVDRAARSSRRPRSGRAASWTRTTSLRRRDGVEAVRHRVLPALAAGHQPHARAAAGTRAGRPPTRAARRRRPRPPAGTPRNASTLHCSIGRPPSSSDCFGTAAPRRRPRPPAAMMAETCIKGRRSGGATFDYTTNRAASRPPANSRIRRGRQVEGRGQAWRAATRPGRR